MYALLMFDKHRNDPAISFLTLSEYLLCICRSDPSPSQAEISRRSSYPGPQLLWNPRVTKPKAEGSLEQVRSTVGGI